jgi:hypothetical protein
MSERRSSAISPYRRAHQAPRTIASRSRSGIESMIVISSETSAGRMRLALVTDPAPGIWQGFRGSSFRSVAVVQSARINW